MTPVILWTHRLYPILHYQLLVAIMAAIMVTAITTTIADIMVTAIAVTCIADIIVTTIAATMADTIIDWTHDLGNDLPDLSHDWPAVGGIGVKRH